jgi:hypothetical protein
MILKPVVEFLASPVKRRLLYIGILGLFALYEFLSLGLARRTFVFYTINDGKIVVEDRMLKRSESKEMDITRYTEEALLGSGSPDLLPLFPRDTRLKSLLYRDGTVYIDFSEAAAMPPAEGGRTLDNFRTLYGCILRNFSYVKDIRFFIEGRSVYGEELGRKGVPAGVSEIQESEAS